MALEILELRALPRQVIDHQIQEDVVMRADPPDVGPCPESRFDLVIGDRREPAIARGRERRKDVDATE